MSDILIALLQSLMPHFLEILGAMLTVLIGWAADTARRRWGLDIEARHREALHSALMTGARIAVERGLTSATGVSFAIGYAESSVPGAITALRPSPEVLSNLARSKLIAAS